LELDPVPILPERAAQFVQLFQNQIQDLGPDLDIIEIPPALRQQLLTPVADNPTQECIRLTSLLLFKKLLNDFCMNETGMGKHEQIAEDYSNSEYIIAKIFEIDKSIPGIIIAINPLSQPADPLPSICKDVAAIIRPVILKESAKKYIASLQETLGNKNKCLSELIQIEQPFLYIKQFLNDYPQNLVYEQPDLAEVIKLLGDQHSSLSALNTVRLQHQEALQNTHNKMEQMLDQQIALGLKKIQKAATPLELTQLIQKHIMPLREALKSHPQTLQLFNLQEKMQQVEVAIDNLKEQLKQKMIQKAQAQLELAIATLNEENTHLQQAITQISEEITALQNTQEVPSEFNFENDPVNELNHLLNFDQYKKAIQLLGKDNQTRAQYIAALKELKGTLDSWKLKVAELFPERMKVVLLKVESAETPEELQIIQTEHLSMLESRNNQMVINEYLPINDHRAQFVKVSVERLALLRLEIMKQNQLKKLADLQLQIDELSNVGMEDLKVDLTEIVQELQKDVVRGENSITTHSETFLGLIKTAVDDKKARHAAPVREVLDSILSSFKDFFIGFVNLLRTNKIKSSPVCFFNEVNNAVLQPIQEQVETITQLLDDLNHHSDIYPSI